MRTLDRSGSLDATAPGAATVTPASGVPGRMTGGGYVLDAAGKRHQFLFFALDTSTAGKRGQLRLTVRGEQGEPGDEFVSSAITSVTFGESPAVSPGRADVPTDSLIMTGTGLWNARPGYTFELRAVTGADEAGRGRDAVAITIRGPGGEIVEVMSGVLEGGAH
jgi:hypothetical protein